MVLQWVASLEPTIFNFCLGHLENELLSFSKFKPELYLRYVDDFFVCSETSLYRKSFSNSLMNCI